MGIYKYNLSNLFIEFLGGVGGGVIGILGIFASAPMIIISMSVNSYNETLAVVIAFVALLSLLISMPICYSDSLAITLLSPYALIALIIIFMLDTVIFMLSLSISGIYKVIKVATSGIYLCIRCMASSIYGIYDNIVEAKKVRDKAKMDKLKAEEDYINKFRIELEHEINRRF